MKFLRYCYSIDIDIQNPTCSSFAKDNDFEGFVVNDKVYLSIRGDINLYVEFLNDEKQSLTNEYLYSWGKNTTTFNRETIGMHINPHLSAKWRLTLLKLHHCLTNDKQYEQYQDMLQIDSVRQVKVELKHINELYFITINGSPLCEEGITNKRIAQELFNIINNDINLYLLRRWPTK